MLASPFLRQSLLIDLSARGQRDGCLRLRSGGKFCEFYHLDVPVNSSWPKLQTFAFHHLNGWNDPPFLLSLRARLKRRVPSRTEELSAVGISVRRFSSGDLSWKKGGMATAGVIDSSPSKLTSRRFYQALRNSLPFTSVNSNSANASSSEPSKEEVKSDTQFREETSLESSAIDAHDKSLPEAGKKYGGDGIGKLKDKLKKKKEIVSSSTVVPRVEVCIGKKCKAKGSEALLADFQAAGDGKVEIAYTKCMKECKQGMNVRVTKDGTTFEWHHEVAAENIQPILCQHFDW